MTTIDEQRKVVTAFQREFRSRPHLPVGKTQKLFPRSALVKGPVWIAQDSFRVSGEEDIRDTLFNIIDFAKVRNIVLPPRSEVAASDVSIEWVGQRTGVGSDARQPTDLLDNAIFQKLQEEVRHSVTMLFAHGGAYYATNTTTARPITTRLARLTKGRVVSVDYRLSPQVQFPAALLDFLLAYLSLLYPPPGSRHTAIAASDIVLTGESSGGGLCLSLVQFILQLRRKQQTPYPRIPFHGREVVVPMPAGVTALGAETDRAMSLPSAAKNAEIDFLQPIPLANISSQPPDDIWPSSPPRHDVYCHSSAYLHPISSPATAADWRGCCPMWYAYGQERCVDGGKMVARTAAEQGVSVRFTEYEGMPHIFAMMFSAFSQSKQCIKEWAEVCCALTEGKEFHGGSWVVGSKHLPGDDVKRVTWEETFPLSREAAMEVITKETEGRRVYTGSGQRRAAL